jgi:hypothetical protein
MAKIVSVVVTDDLDGSADAEAVSFGFDGHSYEIDLGKKNRAKLEKSLQPFMEAGRRTAARKAAKAPRAAGPGTGRAAVRAWAAGQGQKVSERGRISAEVMSRYDAAH